MQHPPFTPPKKKLYLQLDPILVNSQAITQISHHPPVFLCKDFLIPTECSQLINAASDSFQPSPVVGAGDGVTTEARVSQSCYLANNDLPGLIERILKLFPCLAPHQCECPQVGFYQPGGRYDQHFDAFNVSTEDGLRFTENGGQRIGTVLIYLNDVASGGNTCFPLLKNGEGAMLRVTPTAGSALVFFPSYLDEEGKAVLDDMALHAAEPVGENCHKYVSQVWIRQRAYAGLASKRLCVPLEW